MTVSGPMQRNEGQTKDGAQGCEATECSMVCPDRELDNNRHSEPRGVTFLLEEGTFLP